MNQFDADREEGEAPQPPQPTGPAELAGTWPAPTTPAAVVTPPWPADPRRKFRLNLPTRCRLEKGGRAGVDSAKAVEGTAGPGAGTEGAPGVEGLERPVAPRLPARPRRWWHAYHR
jgi:hypothetical protein